MFESEFERSLFALRQEKLKQIAALGHAAYPNHYRTTHDIPALRAHFDGSHAICRALALLLLANALFRCVLSRRYSVRCAALNV